MSVAGASTMPTTGTLSRTSAMLTVKSSPPLTNSLVPSSGSTRKNARPTSGSAPGLHGLLGDHRHARRDLREVAEDDRLGGPVGLGDGGRVGLVADGDMAGADLEDRPPRLDRGGNQGFGKVGVGGERLIGMGDPL